MMKLNFSGQKNAKTKSRKNRKKEWFNTKLFLELLEDRTVPSTFSVTNTGDNGGVNPAPNAGTGTLRQAIIDANTNAGSDTIIFNIPASDSGFVDVDSGLTGGDLANDVFVIKPQAQLPSLLDSGGTVIDGRTQSTYLGNTNPFGPEIVLDGSSGINEGVHILSSNNTIIQLSIQFFGSGIRIEQGSSNWVWGCYLGTDATGTNSKANFNGITIEHSTGSKYNLIGTNGDGVNDTEERNLISGNSDSGIRPGGQYSRVSGNYIGTDRTGTLAIPNQWGILFTGGPGLDSSAYQTIGTNSDGNGDNIEGNIISGNIRFGIVFQGSGAHDNIVAGNLIGTDVTGSCLYCAQHRTDRDFLSQAFFGTNS